MADMMEQAKEAVKEMYRNVVDFLQTNMEVVEDKLGQMVDSMEDGWDNMVDECFNGENEAALQVFLYFLQHHFQHDRFTMYKVVTGASLLLMCLALGIYQYFAGEDMIKYPHQRSNQHQPHFQRQHM